MSARMFRWILPALAIVALAMLSNQPVRADDGATTQPSSTTQPSEANGSIVVTVVGSNNSPVEKASVKLYAKKSKTDTAEQADAKKHTVLARGKTGEDGKFTFSSLASGEYKINASDKESGAKASTTVTLTDQSPSQTVTITLDTGSGNATTSPSPQ